MTQSQLSTNTADAERPTGQAMLRGTRGRCPACGEGKLFQGYLKVADHCPSCGEAMHHQRADDGPAYLTILLVSHLGAPILLASFIAWRPSAMTMIMTFGLGAIVLSLLLLPRIKGAMIGLQWARRMHGFGDAAEPASS
ncbi:DUF983 domain-containing protein [Paracoccus sp. R12_1]|uniref:DUF983 domain-containing protein n=1 Tax=unclassified Paracoccus (in: a-proteobacteria) TaxID=2688777 RepID=UPI000C0A983E|nr:MULTISPECIES: DUF983 domain-containing protein [unclassified Paracoccus (in: a-proteobacteria)]MBO9455177.1 DUF983 domain-containing protein [Paracoccus sp. R12_2]MBO9486451.1 DUF983 domain-containing protein [Paracoccus sp. R12_1]PHQ69133.1 MAG: hypothetical protein COB97_08380 [Paracoccus sp. (in: a-proteobacteria)]